MTVLRILKHSYIAKRIRGILIDNLRLFIHNLLSQLLCYTDIRESSLFVVKIVETLQINILRKPYGLATAFSRLNRI